MPKTPPAIGRGGRVTFVVAILTGSFLLFLVQPMVARMALPRLGGAPAVWNSAMLVYQALLLGGYAYAHALGRVSLRAQAAIHLVLLCLAALWLPIGILAWTLSPGADPVLWVPWLLVLSIGPLFFAVSAQAPLLQRWFAAASGGEDPYRLYAASNLGSFAGLIAYPLVVEPVLPLAWQSIAWSVGYAALVVLVAACALRLPRTRESADAPHLPSGPPPRARQVAYWIALALVPSGLMLATSTYITTDVVAMPLLWVIPLGLYLLSFTIAFAANRAVADTLTRVAPVTVLMFGSIMIGGVPERPILNLLLALVLLFMVSVALHTALHRVRPAPAHLTGFYLAMALGGALGGVFAGLISPIVFDWTWEYPLLILAAGALVPQLYLSGGFRALWHRKVRGVPVAFAAVLGILSVAVLLHAFGPQWLPSAVATGALFVLIGALGLIALGTRFAYLAILATGIAIFGGWNALQVSLEPGMRMRSYFGVYTITDYPDRRVLAHGTTVHGLQLRGSPERERLTTTYYAAGSGVGQALIAAREIYGPHVRIGIVGLGTGTLACFALPRQEWRFYEIDPAVVTLARDSGRFTYLSRCAPQAKIVLGDARLGIAAEPSGSLDLLALDAFSSDAVPMHLLTREAFDTYRRVLSPRGVLLVHVSNRFLDLEPVVSAAARAGGWHAIVLRYRPSMFDIEASSSDWIALTQDAGTAQTLRQREENWERLPAARGTAPWTDDYATILPLLKF